MSYILDALKKADSERARERSAVPGLDAQPEAALGGDMRRGNAPWRAVAIGSVLMLVAFLAWWGLGREEPAVTVPAVAAPPLPVAEPVATAPAPAPAPAPPPEPAAMPSGATPAAPTPTSTPPAALPPVAAAMPPPSPASRPRPIARAPRAVPAATAEPSVTARAAK
ncbi:MAG: hypothetical protein OEV65_10660, partial [Aquincola sp.]|nr:hypothetical protein [Aquincola sp.]